MLNRLQLICLFIVMMLSGTADAFHIAHPIHPFVYKNHFVSLPISHHIIHIPSDDPILQSDTASCSIPFTLAGKLILVQGRADTTVGNFVLDTGAPYLVLNTTYFRDYPVEQTHNESQETIAGEGEPVQQITINWFKLGTLNYYKAKADLVSLAHIENTKGIKILGLLGVSLFKQCELIIDYKNSVIHLHHISKKERKTYQHPMLSDTSRYRSYPFDLVNNRILIKTTIAGKELPFVIDYAAESNIIDSRLPARILDSVAINGRVVMVGAGSEKVEAITGDLLHFKLGDISTGNLSVIIMNLGHSCFGKENCISGVLGHDFLSRYTMAFNFEKRKLYVLNE